MSRLEKRRRPAHLPAALLVGALVAAVVSACVSVPGVPEPAPPPPEVSPELLYSADVETGDLSQFDDTPYNTQASVPPTVVHDPQFVRDGAYSVRMTIPAGADTSTCCGPRSELVPTLPDFRTGDELYFAFSTMLGPGFPDFERWQNIAAWKADPGGSPPLEMGVEQGQYQLAGGFSHPDNVEGSHEFSTFLGPATPGRWADWVVHVKFSADPEVGFVELWRDGALVVPRFHPPGGTLFPVKDADGNLYPTEFPETDGEPRGYFKTGYYRRGGIGPPGTVYFDTWKVGTSYPAVARSG